MTCCSVQCHFGVIQRTCLRLACNSKTAGRRLKRSERFGIGDTSNTYIGHLSYIGSRYMAVRHKPNLLSDKVTKQIVKVPGPLV